MPHVHDFSPNSNVIVVRPVPRRSRPMPRQENNVIRANWVDRQVMGLVPADARTSCGIVRSGWRPCAAGLNGPAKRALDIAVAFPALILLAPLMALIALAIVVESPGSPLFRQRRRGKDDAAFEILKFRSMRPAHEGEELLQAKADDDRITRVGGFLRRSSLDELPQLFNVLKGDMSIVGPRPHAIRHDEIFERHLPDYHLRFRCKPGIIGLAQLNGARGEIRSRRDIQRRTKLDLLYQRRWTLGVDVALVLAAPFKLVADALSKRSY